MPSLSFQNLETTDVSNIIIVSRFSESQAAGMTQCLVLPREWKEPFAFSLAMMTVILYSCQDLLSKFFIFILFILSYCVLISLFLYLFISLLELGVELVACVC